MKIFNLNNNKKVILFFNIVIIVFFYRSFFLGEKFITTNLMYAMPPWNAISDINVRGALLSDPIDQLIPSFFLAKESLKNGIIPLWDPHIAAGAPPFHPIQSIIMYPLNILLVIFPLEIGILMHGYIRIFIALYGMYLFLGRYDLKTSSKIMGALAFAFSGPMIVWFNWAHTDVAAFAPLLFYYMDKSVVDKDFNAMIKSSIILTIMFYAGMPPYVAYFLYLLGLHILFRIVSKNKKDFKSYAKPIAYFILSVGFAAGLSFFYTGSLTKEIELLGYMSQRQGGHTLTLGINYLKEFLYPGQNESSMHFNEYAMYVGVIPLITILVGLSNGTVKDKKGIFWSINTLALMMLLFTDSLNFLAEHLPVVGSSVKIRLLILLMFSLAVLAAISFDKIIEKYKHSIKNSTLILMIIATLIISYTYQIRTFGNQLMKLLPLTISIVFICLVYWTIKVEKHKKAALGMIVVIAAVDLLVWSIPYNPTVAGELPTIPTTSSIEYLQSNSGYDRFVALGQWTLFPNTAAFYGLYDIRAHGFMLTSERVGDFYRQIDKDIYTTKTRTEVNSLDNLQFLNMLSTKFILSPYKLMNRVEILNSDLSKQAVGEITEDKTLRQEFVAEEDKLNTVEVLLATYQRNFDDDVIVHFELIDMLTKEQITTKEVLAKDIKDNEYFSLEFPMIEESRDRRYLLQISSINAEEGRAITAWISTEKQYKPGKLYVNHEGINGDLFIRLGYESQDKNLKFIKVFDDGMYLYENISALPRTYVTRDFIIEEKEDQVIERLYHRDNAYAIVIEENDNIEIESSINNVEEYSKIVQYQPNRVVIEANLNSPAFIVLTDQYFPGWEVKINGSSRKIYRTNAIFRSVIGDEGLNIIEFEYKPQYIIQNMYISISTLLLFIGVIVVNKKSFLKNAANKDQ